MSQSTLKNLGSWLTAVAVFAITATAAANPASTAIRIGGNLEMSGRYAYHGDMAAKGAKLAFKEVNDAGGILGRKIDFVVLDNGSEKSKAAVVMKSLVAGGRVVAVLGCLTTNNTLAAYPAAKEHGIPLISPSATQPHLTSIDGKVNPYIFRTCLADTDQGRIIASFAAEELGAKTAALIIDPKSAYSRDLATAFEQAFTGAGGRIVTRETFTVAGNDYDAQANLAGLANVSADVVFIPIYSAEAGLAIRQLRESGARMPVLGPEAWDYQNPVAYVSEEYLNGVFFTAYYGRSTKLPNIERFRDAFIKENKAEPEMLAFMAYEAARVLIAAIRKAGSADPESIRSALEGIEVDGLLGSIRIDADHNVAKPAIVRKMIDGQPVAYKIYTP